MDLISQFEKFYASVSVDTIEQLGSIYTADAVLIDPICEHHGIENIQQYFRNLLINTRKCNCSIELISQLGDTVFLTWNMAIEHPQLNGGKRFAVEGITHLTTKKDKVTFHRDYYDLGEMVYEQLPVLKHVIKQVKKRMGE